MKQMLCAVAVLVLAGCASSEDGSVVDKVLQDFGLSDRPEGFESGSDKVFERLNEIGATELKRMNVSERHGEVKFEEESGISGKYYKEVRIYENFYPLDATAAPRTSSGARGFVGYIEYAYQVFQSPRKNTRTEAEAESATIPTGVKGRDSFRYKFNASGMWEGGEGEPANR